MPQALLNVIMQIFNQLLQPEAVVTQLCWSSCNPDTPGSQVTNESLPIVIDHTNTYRTHHDCN